MSSSLNPFSATGQPSSGFVSGPQGSYARYQGAEQGVANAAAFAGSGVGGASTMETQADAGANALTAQLLATQSDANAAAQARLQNAQQQAAKSNLSSVGNLGGSILGKLF